MSILVLSASDVALLLDKVSPTDVMKLMGTVFTALSAQPGSDDTRRIQAPHRTSIEMSAHTTLFMPARIASVGTAIKIISIPNAGDRGLPASTVIMDEDSGSVKAIVNAKTLTAARTAAGSALATSLMLKYKQLAQPVEHLVMFGAGLQTLFHARMFLHREVFGRTVKSCTIVNRSMNRRVETLLEDLRGMFPNVDVTAITMGDDSLGGVVQNADIICTATSSTEALFPSEWVKLTAHINLIGSYTPHMREIEDDLVRRAGIVLVDSLEACKKEAGELISAGLGDGTKPQLQQKFVELGQFVSKDSVGEIEISGLAERARGITIFKSVGVGVQDVAIASLIVKIAEERGVGTNVSFE
ncbi:hypothetical protein FRB99_004999 [Tulasnella sp. 403]|nr:hypothetical protein FRB99_004999 [Tulasnella sp. 403]